MIVGQAGGSEGKETLKKSLKCICRMSVRVREKGTVKRMQTIISGGKGIQIMLNKEKDLCIDKLEQEDQVINHFT